MPVVSLTDIPDHELHSDVEEGDDPEPCTSDTDVAVEPEVPPSPPPELYYPIICWSRFGTEENFHESCRLKDDWMPEQNEAMALLPHSNAELESCARVAAERARYLHKEAWKEHEKRHEYDAVITQVVNEFNHTEEPRSDVYRPPVVHPDEDTILTFTQRSFRLFPIKETPDGGHTFPALSERVTEKMLLEDGTIGIGLDVGLLTAVDGDDWVEKFFKQSFIGPIVECFTALLSSAPGFETSYSTEIAHITEEPDSPWGAISLESSSSGPPRAMGREWRRTWGERYNLTRLLDLSVTKVAIATGFDEENDMYKATEGLDKSLCYDYESGDDHGNLTAIYDFTNQPLPQHHPFDPRIKMLRLSFAPHINYMDPHGYIAQSKRDEARAEEDARTQYNTAIRQVEDRVRRMEQNTVRRVRPTGIRLERPP